MDHVGVATIRGRAETRCWFPAVLFRPVVVASTTITSAPAFGRSRKARASCATRSTRSAGRRRGGARPSVSLLVRPKHSSPETCTLFLRSPSPTRREEHRRFRFVLSHDFTHEDYMNALSDDDLSQQLLRFTLALSTSSSPVHGVSVRDGVLRGDME